ncbi:MAG TPA: hypothetical protein DEQ87_18245 [Algoriphagus sp.]|nr:hypothetical protein [Algoriphagus sp.]MAN85865.1 hypothetical protein [Algoriphagus sp.]HAD50554.1 hypothetical protein [Algoriphagus sp.]HCD89555.1 hypothetical protein [Algoriphagus sp.]HCH44391.1 hypothetical protein [Algoriphagus sp.]
MQKPFFLMIILIISFSYLSHAQNVGGVALEDIKSTYIHLSRVGSTFKSKIRVSVDFGQRLRDDRLQKSFIVDSDGRPIEFNSMIDALNLFDLLGYEYVDSSCVNEDWPVQYLLRKKKSEMIKEEE